MWYRDIVIIVRCRSGGIVGDGYLLRLLQLRRVAVVTTLRGIFLGRLAIRLVTIHVADALSVFSFAI